MCLNITIKLSMLDQLLGRIPQGLIRPDLNSVEDKTFTDVKWEEDLQLKY